MKKKVARMMGAGVAVLSLYVGGVAQAAQDWATIGSGVDSEIAAAAPVAFAVFGSIVAITVGIKVFRKVAG